jgi:hypothetical protein
MKTMRRILTILSLASTSLTVPGLGCAARPAAVEAAAEPAPHVLLAEAQALGSHPSEAKSVLPADRGSALLLELLAPSGKGHGRLDAAMSPKRPFIRDMNEPLWLLPVSTNLPSLPRELGMPTKKQRPAQLPEPLPLFDQLASPRLPEAQHLLVGPRLRMPSPDVNQPPPLPILAHQVLDRTSLDDPTLDASLAMALALAPPIRVNPAPFLRLVLPNPFEHRETGRLRQPPPEDSTPMTATPRIPGK